MRIGCVVMAAGDARRFGENKLAALFDGKPLILRALEAVPAEEFSAVAVVTQYPEVEALASEFGFLPVHNPHPDWGISHTIRLGLEALGDCAGEKYRIWTSRKRETSCWVRPGSRLDQGSLDRQRICFKGMTSGKVSVDLWEKSSIIIV